jgi:glutamate-5-semialdehyde dehydrogenase
MDNGVIEKILVQSRDALVQAPPVGDEAYVRFARSLGSILDRRWPEIEAANERDLVNGRERGLPETLLDRMRLTRANLAALQLLVGDVQRAVPETIRPGYVYHGIQAVRSRRVPRPLGVILMIYEARPMVTVDGALLTVCAGNVVLLRGGTEIAETNAVLSDVITSALHEADLPEGMARSLTGTSRAQIREMLARDDAIDVLIPRGGPSLIDFCRRASRIPMIAGGGGVNHLYVHETADPGLAVRVVLDSKLPEPAGCTALEMVLLDEGAAQEFFTAFAAHAADPGVRQLTVAMADDLRPRMPEELRAAIATRSLTDQDYGREFLDRTLALRMVHGLDEAVEHIRRHGSRHTEGIVTGDQRAADAFCHAVDAAAVVVNGSLRLHDGPTLGVGGEIAISTGRLQVRGPVTLQSLLTYSWRVEGHGAMRFRTN